VESLVWRLWAYLKSDDEIAARWREYVPAGERHRGRLGLPPRSDSADPGEIIEHVRLSLLKFFDLAEIVARARERPAAVSEDELHDVRAVDLLLFEFFGEDGMLLPPAVYAAPLAAAARQALETLAPLAAHHPDVRRLCDTLVRLAPFYASYHPWAEALDLGRDGPRESIARWRELLEDVRNTSGRMRRSRTLAGELLPAWQAAAEVLANQQVFLRLQLAMRVAVEREDPTCRHLCASRSLLAQIAAERVGLARRRRFHPRSEAAIIAAKLCARRQMLLSLPPAQPWIQIEATALTDDCHTLLGLLPAPMNSARRQAALDCADRIQRRDREMRAMLADTTPAANCPQDQAVIEAARAVAATAGDLADGFFAAKQRKGLQSLIPRRRGDRLEDTLTRC
jgi:hypothetical protein